MSENIETPNGWERMGHRFVRAYGHRLAVMANDPSDGTWLPWIHESVNSVHQGRWKPLPEAVAWANEQLGVPKPVEVVRTEYKDAWILTCEQTGRSDRVSKDAKCRDYADIYVALRESEKYVRGDA